ncbi:MAG: ATP-binding protein [Candidatus Omnitrophica bacterium]|nr:ATP-binding protein [Candidatus Omnitrophota bacterium]
MAIKGTNSKSKQKIIPAEALLYSQEYDFVINSLPLPVFIYSPQGVLIKANLFAIKKLGFNPENLNLKDVVVKLNAHLASGRKITLKNLPSAQAFKGKVVQDRQLVLRDVEGNEHVVFVSASPVRSQGKVICIMVVWHDVTERVAAEDALKNTNLRIEVEVQKQTRELIKSNQSMLAEIKKRIAAQNKLEKSYRLLEIGRLAATVAHELRNPLGAIRVAAYNIKIKVNSPRIESNLANIETKIIESEQIISNLLSYARIKIPRFEPVKISQLLNECIDSALERFRKRKMILNRNILGIKDEVIWADPLQLKEVFHNILDNAFDACVDKEGQIGVLAAKTALGQIMITFKDNGEGISDELAKKIFEPFFTTKSKGTGLGLSICKQIIDLHDGEILVKSKPGQGTSVEIVLPIRAASLSKARSEKAIPAQNS